ncbi:MAG: hypothetical protein A4E70_02469 [Syntrophus sp. PtaU1.Bin005]|nr:MAG: hypothetical protein A4E70_02469 [Syntrophus sp. PtaU1.Bin005]
MIEDVGGCAAVREPLVEPSWNDAALVVEKQGHFVVPLGEIVGLVIIHQAAVTIDSPRRAINVSNSGHGKGNGAGGKNRLLEIRLIQGNERAVKRAVEAEAGACRSAEKYHPFEE